MESELQEMDSSLNESNGDRINVSSELNNSDSNSSSSSSELVDESSIKDDLPFLNYDPPSTSQTASSPGNIQELEKKFAAYVRKDVYGVMGRGELPLREKVFIGIALVTLVPLRLVVAFLILLLYYLICRLCTLLLTPYRDDEQEDYAHMGGWRRAVIFYCGKFLSRAMLFTVGFYWIKQTHGNHPNAIEKSTTTDIGHSVHEGQAEEPERAGVIISNHVSYLDILYHMSSSFPSFVAKRSVAKIPLVGLISKCLGCVYVQRESKSSDFKGVSGVVTERIQEAHQNMYAPIMMLFPEGTTTNGEFLLPFKTGAFLSKTPVLPLILKYPYHRFSPAWDSISGVRHVIFLLCQFVNHLEVTQLPLYHPSQQEKENSALYAANVRSLMAREGNLTVSDIGLPEKRIYHTALNGSFLKANLGPPSL